MNTHKELHTGLLREGYYDKMFPVKLLVLGALILLLLRKFMTQAIPRRGYLKTIAMVIGFLAG